MHILGLWIEHMHEQQTFLLSDLLGYFKSVIAWGSILKENNKKKEGDSMTKKYLFCFN